MKVTGLVSEVSKKPKSWKMIINKKTYYCQTDVTSLSGKNIEADYTESQPYANPVNPNEKITSKYIEFSSIKILDGQTPPPAPVTPPKHTEPVNDNEPDWDNINLQKYRRDAINCATALVAQGKVDLKDLYITAKKMVEFILTGGGEIPF